MQAVYFLGKRALEIADIPDPTPGPGEVVLETRAAGMCGSDLRVYRAAKPSPFIAGHEPCGVVTEVGPGVTERDARIGQRVMNHHYTGCGACSHCLDGWSQMCAGGSVVFGRTGDGSHAEYMKVPAYTLVPRPVPRATTLESMRTRRGPFRDLTT